MLKHESDIPSLQASCWCTDDNISIQQPYAKDNVTTNVHPLEMMHRNSYDTNQGSINRLSLCHVIDPRFITHHSSKILPYRDDGDIQTMWKHSLNVSFNSTNTTLNQTHSSHELKPREVNSTSEVTGEEHDTHKERYYRIRRCAYMLICGLCIALIVVPIAFLFGLPRASTITTVTTTISKTTTTTPIMVVITQAADPIVGVYGTIKGGSTGGSNGNYASSNQTPVQAIDGVLGTKYVNFGLNGANGYVRPNAGVNTGFYITPTISSYSMARALLFATANDYPERDPLTVTLEGTNATGTGALDLGSNWILIYTGPTGINPRNDPGRLVYGSQQNFSNTIAYSSYRLLVTSQRSDSDCTQYAEVQIIGYI